MQKIKKWISSILVFAMLICTLPTKAFADQNYQADNTNNASINKVRKEPKIIKELTEKRDANTKYFLMDNGSYEAVTYSQPVHFLKNGKWADINNSLQDAADDSDTSILNDGTVYGSGTEDEGTKSSFENTNNGFKVKIAKNAMSSKLVSVKKGDYELSWNLPDASNVKAQKIDVDQNAIDASIQKTVDDEMSKDSSLKDATPEEKADIRKTKIENEKIKTLPNIESKIQFSNIFPSVDLQYMTVGNMVKENIVINDKIDNPVFKFDLKVKKLVPKLDKYNNIIFYDSENNEVYQVNAPYMYDANHVVSNKIQVALNQNKDGYELDIIPDKDWMDRSDVAYPITIDPPVNTSPDVNSIIDTFACSNDTSNKYNNQFLDVGNTPAVGVTRAFIKFPLPSAISSADMVTSAQLNIAVNQTYNGVGQINVHKVTQDWVSDLTHAVTWSNMPSYSPKIQDYTSTSSVNNGWLSWDITGIAKDWFTTGQNYGVMLKYNDESNGYTELWSSDIWNGYSTIRPMITFQYVNYSGLEDFWTYHSANAGSRAGTGYVNDYNGNLIFVHDDLDMNGSKMPINLNHVYNSTDRAISRPNSSLTTNTTAYYGPGWRLNLSQSVEAVSISGTTWYKYTDEDGTEHYFYYDSATSKYIDELGTGLTLQTNYYNGSDHGYCITDKKSNKLIFTAAGFLYKIQDANINTLTLSYSGAVLSKITDGAGRVTTLNSTSDGVLAGITDPDGRTTSFSYAGAVLKTITYPDGKYTTYNYDSNNNLLSAINFDGIQLTYTYYSSSPYRVKSVTRSNVDGTQGGTLSMVYGNNETTFTDAKNRTETYQFNNCGNTISVKNADNSAMYYKYANNDNNGDSTKNNQLTLNSKLQSTIINYLQNCSAEYSDQYWNSGYSGSVNGTSGPWGTCSVTTAQKYLGNQSFMVSKNTAGNDTQQFYNQTLTNLQKGSTYTLSGYIKTDSITTGNNGGAMLFVNYQDSSGNNQTQASQLVTGTNDWQRYQATFTIPQDSASNSVNIRFGIAGEIGTAYFDGLQLESGSIANRYNLVENSDFMYGGAQPNFWTKSSDCDSNDFAKNYSGKNSFQLNGFSNKCKNISQTINVSGDASQSIVISGWAKADSVPINSGRYFALDVGIINTDSTVTWNAIPFNQGVSDWQYLSDVIIPANPYKGIIVDALYYNNANTAYFTDLQAYQEEFGTSYQYDSNGNVKSSTDLAKQSSTFQYNGSNDLMSETDPKGSTFNYTYDGNHNIKTATSAENVVYSFDYDSNGNPIKSTIGNSTLFISSSAAYTDSGNYVKSLTDSSGNTVYSNWDETKGILNSSVDANGNTTYNSYDNMDRLQSVSKTLGGNALENFPLSSSTSGSNGTKTISENAVYEKDNSGKSYFASYEPTTNLIPTNSSFESGLTGWTYSDWSNSTGKWRLANGGVNGVQALEFYDSSIDGIGTNAVGYQTITLPSALTANTNYTISAYSKISGTSQPMLGIDCFDVNGNPVTNGYQNFTKTIGSTGVWTKISQTFSVPAGTKKFYAMIRTGVKDSDTVDYDAVQVEAKSYDSPYTPSTSTASKLVYNLGITKNSGTMSLKFNSKVAGPRQLIANQGSNGVFFNTYIDANNIVQLALVHNDGSTLNLISTPSPISNNVEHQMVITWQLVSGTLYCVLYIDGVPYKGNTSDFQDFSGGQTGVGNSISGIYQLDGDIEQFNYSPKVLSQTDLQALFAGTLTNTPGTTVTNSYSYLNDMIQSITHNGFSYNFGYDSLGNNTTVSVGNQNLITNSYETTTGKLLSSTYGNGQAVSYKYDDWDRLTGKVDSSDPNAPAKFSYQYDASGNLGYLQDLVNQVNYRYIYDTADRLVKVQDSNGNALSYDYDKNNNTDKLVDTVNNNTYTTGYGYDKDNKLKEVDLNNGVKVLWNYDPTLGRLSNKTINVGTGFVTNYTYLKGVNTNSTTAMIDTIDNNGTKTSYTYDNNGNIKTITYVGIPPQTDKTITYSYNELNELVREDNQVLNKTIVYSYDGGGNIQSKKEYTYTDPQSAPQTLTNSVDYHYNNVWKDELTSITTNGVTTSIAYDTSGKDIGNPLSYNGMSFTWEWGRQLKSIGNVPIINGSNTTYDTMNFLYNDAGIRTQKKFNGVTTNYHLVGDKVTYEDNGTDKIYYTYDSDGKLVSMNITTKNSDGTWTTPAEYYYIRNAQGDIIGLIDGTGAQVVSYTYDSWGKLISIDGTLKDTVGVKNPYRYRGYRYDTETGLYYLQSRYYSPDWGRFINADALAGKVGQLLSHNVFSYCQNNPINFHDSNGFEMEEDEGGSGSSPKRKQGGPTTNQGGGTSGKSKGSKKHYDYAGAAESVAYSTGVSAAAEKTIDHCTVEPGFRIPVKINDLYDTGEFFQEFSIATCAFSVKDDLSGQYCKGEAWSRVAIDVTACAATIALTACGGWAAVGIGLGIGVLAETIKYGIDVAFKKYF